MNDDQLTKLAQEVTNLADENQELCPTCEGVGFLDGIGDVCPDCEGEGFTEI